MSSTLFRRQKSGKSLRRWKYIVPSINIEMLRVFQHRYLNVKTLVDQRCPLKSQILNVETTYVNYDVSRWLKLLKELFSWNAFYMSVVLYLPFWLFIISDLLQHFSKKKYEDKSTHCQLIIKTKFTTSAWFGVYFKQKYWRISH